MREWQTHSPSPTGDKCYADCEVEELKEILDSLCPTNLDRHAYRDRLSCKRNCIYVEIYYKFVREKGDTYFKGHYQPDFSATRNDEHIYRVLATGISVYRNKDCTQGNQCVKGHDYPEIRRAAKNRMAERAEKGIQDSRTRDRRIRIAPGPCISNREAKRVRGVRAGTLGKGIGQGCEWLVLKMEWYHMWTKSPNWFRERQCNACRGGEFGRAADASREPFRYTPVS
ncbi:hypothetical protein PSPO01_07637 [Paraphaeosphaeria sporulosa]